MESAGRCIGAARKQRIMVTAGHTDIYPSRFEGKVCAFDNKCLHQV